MNNIVEQLENEISKNTGDIKNNIKCLKYIKIPREIYNNIIIDLKISNENKIKNIIWN